jgi:hypothetical protein
MGQLDSTCTAPPRHRLQRPLRRLRLRLCLFRIHLSHCAVAFKTKFGLKKPNETNPIQFFSLYGLKG